MNIMEAIKKIAELQKLKVNLVNESEKYQTTRIKNEKINKGWVGQTIEKCVGLKNNSDQSPDGGDWELKTVKFKVDKAGNLTPAETMSITMIDEDCLVPFSKSHLYSKIRKMLLVGVVYYPDNRVEVVSHVFIDLTNPKQGALMSMLQKDYDLVIKNLTNKVPLSSKMGEFIQPRTKGAGGTAPKTRAFYAKIILLRQLFAI